MAPRSDVGTLRSHLPCFANIDLSIRSEGDFFPAFSGFYFMRGWHRQQIIKLHVPVVLGFAGYLTLDADVCCVGDFNATTFVADGRALSQWAHKYRHDWWHQTAKALGVPYAPLDHGLAVTPNILHGALAAQALEHFRIGLLSPTVVLSGWLMRRPGSIPWTEYSIYTCVAERKGNLLDDHVPWTASNETPLLSYSHSVWHPSQRDRLSLYTPSSPPDAPFVRPPGQHRGSLAWRWSGPRSIAGRRPYRPLLRRELGVHELLGVEVLGDLEIVAEQLLDVDAWRIPSRPCRPAPSAPSARTGRSP